MASESAVVCRFSILFCGLTIAVAAHRVPAPAVDASATVRLRSETATSFRTDGPNSVGNGVRPPEAAVNESAAIDLCRNYVEAQFEYFRLNPNADGVLAFAQKIRSTPGKHDGLYWSIDAGEAESPLGPNVAAAAVTERETEDDRRPSSGFYVKILLAQGPAAMGGARDYVVDGRLATGFALVVWPARYGVTGVQSFLVNHLGDVYARDLGSDTSRIASRLSAFNPDHNWTKIASRDEDR